METMARNKHKEIIIAYFYRAKECAVNPINIVLLL